MMLTALILAAGVETAAQPAGDLARFTAEAETLLLHGKPLPPDYRLRLLAMAPADRLQAIIYLRRAGLLTAAAWSLQDLLRNPDPQEMRP